MEPRTVTLLVPCRLVAHVTSRYTGSLGDAVWRLIWLSRRQKIMHLRAWLATAFGLTLGVVVYRANPGPITLVIGLLVIVFPASLYARMQLLAADLCIALMASLKSRFDEDWDAINEGIVGAAVDAGRNPQCQEITVELEPGDPE